MSVKRSAILTYHSIDGSGSVLSTSPRLFQEQMQWLASSGIPVVPLVDVRSAPGSIALTFDDGFRNFLTEAVPVLERLRLPATLFVVSGFCGRTNGWRQSIRVPEWPLLDWAELREVRARGIALGAHGVTHASLPALSELAVMAELEGSRSAIQDHVGAPVDAFAYPYGATNPLVRGLAARRFRLACGTALRFVQDDDPWSLPRIDTFYLRQPYWFERVMTRAGQAYIAGRRLLRETRACLFPSS